MDTHEWLDREKLIDWLDHGFSCRWQLHGLEVGFIKRAVQYFVENHNLNPVAQEVYDHLKMQWDESELETPYPTVKFLRRLYDE